jgi:hypothetical protein
MPTRVRSVTDSAGTTDLGSAAYESKDGSTPLCRVWNAFFAIVERRIQPSAGPMFAIWFLFFLDSAMRDFSQRSIDFQRGQEWRTD